MESENQFPKKNGVYTTSSLNIVAYLLMKGVKCDSTVKYSTGTLFVFTKNQLLEQVLDEYYNNTFIHEFIKSLKDAKSQVIR